MMRRTDIERLRGKIHCMFRCYLKGRVAAYNEDWDGSLDGGGSAKIVFLGGTVR